MKYIKQLDSLRAIAVFLVIINHWLPRNNILNSVPNGSIGVDIFFVLSGFLITRILFENRNKAGLLRTTSTTLIKNFYVRRSLRIFPVYYLTIFLLLAFHEATGTHIQSAFLYFATYTSNFYFLKIHSWDGMLSHLWSLAVEEQFYLIWPWIILFINRKYYLPVILCFIAIGVMSQVILRAMPMSDILTFCCFDAFGFGALLAWQVTYKRETLNKFYQRISVIAAVVFVLFIFEIIYRQGSYIPLRTTFAIITVWIMAYIIQNQDTGKMKFKFILNNPVFIFFGKISYGIYLYHNIIPSTINSKFINIYFNPYLPNFLFKSHWGQLYFCENLILLIIISWLSFRFIEKPFLHLKQRFEYQKA